MQENVKAMYWTVKRARENILGRYVDIEEEFPPAMKTAMKKLKDDMKVFLDRCEEEN